MYLLLLLLAKQRLLLLLLPKLPPGTIRLPKRCWFLLPKHPGGRCLSKHAPVAVSGKNQMDIDDMDFAMPAAPQDKTNDWVLLYPIYLDAAATVRKGRRVARDHAVDQPVSLYMFEACKRLGLEAEYESDKQHPKDQLVFGRVKVQLRRNAVPVVQSIASKQELLKRIAQMLALVEIEMIDADPRIKAVAATSRSALASVIRELNDTTIEPVVKPKKKSKKNR